MRDSVIQKLLADGRSFTTQEAIAVGISRQVLCNYCNSGKLMRLGRGIYLPTGNSTAEEPEIEALQRKGIDFVLCLFSALKFYHIGTQNTPEIWIAVKNTVHPPVLLFPLKCIRLGEAYYNSLIVTHTLNGMPIRVYSPAKTIADCFRFRNLIGLDVALEALRDGWQKKLFTADELYQAAQMCHVSKIITPYMEMLIG